MRISVEKGKANGRIAAPPSKSAAHRLLIAASLADGESVISSLPDCDDAQATLSCLAALGVEYTQTGDTVTVRGKSPLLWSAEQPLDCRESGSTLRFLIPLALVSGKEISFCGSKRLMERPQSEYETVCREKGLRFEKKDGLLTVQGPLRSGKYTLSGGVSSQFITGLLFALATLKGDSEIEILPPVESRPYIDMTLVALQAFGVRVRKKGKLSLYIKGGQSFQSQTVKVEGDYSGAAFLSALGGLGGRVVLDGLNKKSPQGDKVCAKYLKKLKRKKATLDLSDCPDLAPVLFAFAAANHGGVFTGTERLKIKESDRAAVMKEELEKFGVTVEIGENCVKASAGLTPPNKPLFGHNDHRIVMALCVLLTKTGGVIDGAEAVRKSYPNFFSDLKRLGIGVTEYDAE